MLDVVLDRDDFPNIVALNQGPYSPHCYVLVENDVRNKAFASICVKKTYQLNYGSDSGAATVDEETSPREYIHSSFFILRALTRMSLAGRERVSRDKEVRAICSKPVLCSIIRFKMSSGRRGHCSVSEAITTRNPLLDSRSFLLCEHLYGRGVSKVMCHCLLVVVEKSFRKIMQFVLIDQIVHFAMLQLRESKWLFLQSLFFLCKKYRKPDPALSSYDPSKSAAFPTIA